MKSLQEAKFDNVLFSDPAFIEITKQTLKAGQNYTTADEWWSFGRYYFYKEKEKDQDYWPSIFCYYHALSLDPQHANSFYALGQHYEYGRGVDKDLNRAKFFYKRTDEARNYNAEVKKQQTIREEVLQRDSNRFTTADQWFDLHSLYKDQKKLEKCIFCCEKAIELDPYHPQALFYLGTAYQFAQGVEKDVEKAKKYYRRSVVAGYSYAEKMLLKINISGIKTAEEWHALGETYFIGEVRSQCDFRAIRCYEIALEIDKNHAASQYSMGRLYYLGHGIPVDYIKAREWYIKADAQGFKNARNGLKQLNRRIAFNILAEGKGIDTKDNTNSTLLHWAARHKHLKDAARLILLGASKEIKDAKSETPFFNLDEMEMRVITSLQTQVCHLAHNLQEAPAKVLPRRLFVDRAVIHEEQVTAVLDVLYQQAAISPLLDLAKLAALALHNLSKRKKFEKNLDGSDYDSDNDVDEKISENQYLSIRVDPDSHLVCGVAHFDKEGLGGKDALGVFLPPAAYEISNTIFIGGKRTDQQAFRGTFIHELTHFIALEVFDNSCNPYRQDDQQNIQNFTQIADDLEQKQLSLDPILRGAFIDSYKDNKQVHCELIVRVAQVMVAYTNGLLRLQQQAPALLNYYNQVFLEGVKKHIENLETRALSGWPRNCFVPQGRIFHFEKTLEKEKDELNSPSALKESKPIEKIPEKEEKSLRAPNFLQVNKPIRRRTKTDQPVALLQKKTLKDEEQNLSSAQNPRVSRCAFFTMIGVGVTIATTAIICTGYQM